MADGQPVPSEAELAAAASAAELARQLKCMTVVEEEFVRAGKDGDLKTLSKMIGDLIDVSFKNMSIRKLYELSELFKMCLYVTFI